MARAMRLKGFEESGRRGGLADTLETNAGAPVDERRGGCSK